MPLLEDTLRRIRPLDRESMAVARHHQNNLAKPLNSLGRLEEVAVHLAGMAAQPFFEVRGKAVIVAAADHGLAAEGASLYSQDSTTRTVASVLGGGAAVNVLARLADARVVVVDVGMAQEMVGVPGLVSRRVRAGARSMARGAAMALDEARQAVEAGIAVAQEEVERGADVLGAGSIAAGGETAAAALIAAVTGRTPDGLVVPYPEEDEEVLDRRRSAVRQALEVNRPDPAAPLEVLAAVGGLEVAALAGVILGAAAARRPVVLDGAPAWAAALAVSGLSARALDYAFFAQQTNRADQEAVLEHLQAVPLLDLGMWQGDGGGAALGIAVVEAAARCQAEMATYSQAGLGTPPE